MTVRSHGPEGSRQPVRGGALAAAASLLLSGLLAACTAPPPPDPYADDEPAGATVMIETVERRTFDTVLSLPATVVAGMAFQVTAPASGTLVERDGALFVQPESGRILAVGGDARIETLLVEPGTEVVAGLPLAEAVHEGFALRASVTGEHLLRLTASTGGSTKGGSPVRAAGEVRGSSGPFDCDLVDPVPSSTDPSVVEEGSSFLACAVPETVRVIAGMSGQLVVTLATHDNVLSLPLEAIAGTVDRARVSVKDGDEVVERDVTLGGSNGYLVEIVDGLREGDEVLIPSPSLLE